MTQSRDFRDELRKLKFWRSYRRNESENQIKELSKALALKQYDFYQTSEADALPDAILMLRKSELVLKVYSEWERAHLDRLDRAALEAERRRSEAPDKFPAKGALMRHLVSIDPATVANTIARSVEQIQEVKAVELIEDFCRTHSINDDFLEAWQSEPDAAVVEKAKTEALRRKQHQNEESAKLHAAVAAVMDNLSRPRPT